MKFNLPASYGCDLAPDCEPYPPPPSAREPAVLLPLISHQLLLSSVNVIKLLLQPATL